MKEVSEPIAITEVNMKGADYVVKYRDNTDENAQFKRDLSVTTNEEPTSDFFEALSDLQESIMSTYGDLMRMDADDINLINIKRNMKEGVLAFEFDAKSKEGIGSYDIKLSGVSDADWDYVRSFLNEAKEFALRKKCKQQTFEFGSNDQGGGYIQEEINQADDSNLNDEDYDELLDS